MCGFVLLQEGFGVKVVMRSKCFPEVLRASSCINGADPLSTSNSYELMNYDQLLLHCMHDACTFHVLYRKIQKKNSIHTIHTVFDQLKIFDLHEQHYCIYNKKLD